MRHPIIYTFALFILIQPTLAQAAMTTTAYPHDLLYQNKPIDALCWYEVQTKEGLISLDKCGLKSESNRAITGVDKKFLDQGYLGYDYVWTIDEIESHGFSYYKILGKINNDYIIYTLNKSGGSGSFSALYRINREQNKLHFNLIASGDRCNGGISLAEVKGYKLIYTINITSNDLFTFTNHHVRDPKVLTSLATCSLCCIGTAKFALDLNQRNSVPKLLMIDLNSPMKELGTPSENNYQFCLNKLLNTYSINKTRYLNPKQLENFVDEFNKECVDTK